MNIEVFQKVPKIYYDRSSYTEVEDKLRQSHGGVLDEFVGKNVCDFREIYALMVCMFNKYSSCRIINKLPFFVYHCLRVVVLLFSTFTFDLYRGNFSVPICSTIL